MLSQQEAKRNGYTLLETLIVLVIVSIMSFVLVMNLNPIYHKKVIDTFLNQLEKDLLYAQQYALVNESTVYVVFSESEKKYRVANGIGDNLLSRNYHQHIIFESATLENRVIYNRQGSIQKSGTMFINYHSDKYRLVIYLGKGRFTIEKL